MSTTTEGIRRINESLEAWHITMWSELGYGDGRLVVAGETLEMWPSGSWKDPLLCYAGMHGHLYLRDCLRFFAFNRWKGSVQDKVPFQLWRVKIWGDLDGGYRKICGRYRQPLWGVSLNEFLRPFLPGVSTGLTVDLLKSAAVIACDAHEKDIVKAVEEMRSKK